VPSLAATRAAAQLLYRPDPKLSVADIVREAAGLQDQDQRWGRLAVRARSRSHTAADVNNARTQERSIVRGWCMRKTAHLIATEDEGWLFPLYDPLLESWSRRRLDQLGMKAGVVDRALAEWRKALAANGPMKRPALIELLRSRDFKLAPEHGIHLSVVATASGLAAFGPDHGKTTTFVLRDDWLPPRKPYTRDAALAELTRRYLRAFGPATEAGFAGWAGLPLRDVRAGLGAVSVEIREVKLGEDIGYALKQPGRRPGRRPICLLAGFDTYLMGHRDREFIAAGERWKQIIPGGGWVRPAILRDGVAIGTWDLKRPQGKLEATIEPYQELDAATAAAVEDEIADVGRFEGADVKIVATEVTGV
jgi:hypothetical protein